MLKKNKKILERQLSSLPKKIQFCTICVTSNQRPRIIFKNGICSACNYHMNIKPNINWKKSEIELKKLLNYHRSKNGDWDVLVPVSGGRDSSFVAHQLKEKYKMNPLCITFSPFKYTDIGFQNFENFSESGFNVLSFSPNGKIYKVLSRIAFEELGDNFTPFVFGQMGYVQHIANKFNIKLVFYGELAELEYGGNPKEVKKGVVARKKMEKHYFKGSDVKELINYGIKNYPKLFKKNDFTKSDINMFELPKTLKGKNNWYSHYYYWKPQYNYYYTFKNNKFRPNFLRSVGTYTKCNSLDDKLDWLHYYMMYIKLGIGRATSDASRDIREGLITRQEGCNLVKQFDHEILDENVDYACNYLGITKKKFEEIVDSFRSNHLWTKKNGKYRLKHTVNKDGVDD